MDLGFRTEGLLTFSLPVPAARRKGTDDTRRLRMEPVLPGLKRGRAVEWQVVGVSRDVRNANARSEPVPEITLPFRQSPWPVTTMAVRTAGAPASGQPGVAAGIRSLDPDLPMAEVKTMEQVGGFAAVALLLAAGGIYGVMSFVVAQRTREIGLRMALGAGRGRVLRDVLRGGMTTALVGTALGAAGAGLVGRLMRGLVYGVGAVDPMVFGVVALVLLAAALVACLVPARRAASVDPMVALRQD